MKLVVTGREGQVVRSLAERAARRGDIELIALGRPELDLSDPDSVAAAIERARPDIVVSAAAYTAVDKAEAEPELAFAVNERGARAVATAAYKAGALVIHLSTDYVFSGEGREAITEAAPPGPRNVYGRSKLAGETAVAEANPEHIILRTSWVYSPFGKNFVKTMLELAETRDRLTVIDDQHGNPTSAHDIADALLVVVNRWRSAGGAFPAGIYHFSGTGETSWYGFARFVLEVSRSLGGPFAEVSPITTMDYPTKAARPENSRLDCSRFAADFGLRAPDWRTSAKLVVERLVRTSG